VAQLGNVYRATGDQRVGQSVKTAGRLGCAQRESGLLRGDKAPTKRRDRVTMAFFLQANATIKVRSVDSTPATRDRRSGMAKKQAAYA
jgi:hypothetical protein